jgi:phosphohistidine swiveling domain-containing protein
MKDNKTWVNNFTVDRVGYHVMSPIMVKGFFPTFHTFFGEGNPIHMTECVMEFEGPNLIFGGMPEVQINNLVKGIIDKIFSDPDFVKRNHNESYKFNDEYFSFAKECLSIDLGKIHDKKLGELYHDLVELQQEAHGHSLCTTWFADSNAEEFSKILIEKTKELVKGTNHDFAKVFSVLTTLPRHSFVPQEEIETFELLVNLDNNSMKALLVMEDMTSIPKQVSDDVKKKILTHYEKWRWLQFDYMGPAYDIDYFLTIWQGLLKEKVDLSSKLEELKNKPKLVEEKRKKLFEELSVPKDLQKIYELAANMAFLKGYRKECSFHGFYVLSFILKEMAKRLSLSMNQIYYLTFQETEDIFLHGKEVGVEEINRRQKYAVWYIQDGGKLEIYSGKDAENYISKIEKKVVVIDSSQTEFYGTTACSGKVKGVVKIINHTEDMCKMNKGDIMVSHSTFPSLVPAMKKAAAIITEDGGITCHAAIVSREMGTPCVTGIKTACKSFSDGMEVLVDASEGIVRKI